jgi:hypothetical protein
LRRETSAAATVAGAEPARSGPPPSPAAPPAAAAVVAGLSEPALAVLTEQVLRRIERRALAQRERLGVV